MEASSAFRGVGLVKLMGRSSGFIAMQASMASGKLSALLSYYLRGQAREHVFLTPVSMLHWREPTLRRCDMLQEWWMFV